MLTDSFHRRIRYLRLSITDRCNLRCSYCKPGICGANTEVFRHIDHNEIMTYEELLRISRIFARLGVEKIRVTGGEPLVRKNLPGLISDLCGIDGINDVALTTNGVLLRDYAAELKKNGLKRVNISLDSLVPSKFAQITGKNEFERVWQGVLAAVDTGFDPVKINVVAMRGINDDEFINFARLAAEMSLHVRFIEFMPMAFMAEESSRKRIPSEEIKKEIESFFNLEPLPRSSTGGPAECYSIIGSKGTVGFISPISKHFCAECNRMRVTAAGSIKPCLLSGQEFDVKKIIRSGADDSALGNMILEAAALKWQGHEINKDGAHVRTDSGIMHRIGG